MFCSLIIFTVKKQLPPHADPTSIPQFCVIYNFSARSILVSCMPAALQASLVFQLLNRFDSLFLTADISCTC